VDKEKKSDVKEKKLKINRGKWTINVELYIQLRLKLMKLAFHISVGTNCTLQS
jgi:hypothetical protein